MSDNFLDNLTIDEKQKLLKALQASLEPQEEPVSSISNEDVPEEFIMKKRDTDGRFLPEGSKGIPVDKIPHENTFVDDGTEAKGEEFETPGSKLTERRRPPVKRVNQTCSRCGKSVKVHPVHARDWFICDKCIGVR